jgi:hypothetical protein
MLIDLFNMPPTDYRRFLSFLRKHDGYERVPRVHVEAALPRIARQKSSEV